MLRRVESQLRQVGRAVNGHRYIKGQVGVKPSGPVRVGVDPGAGKNRQPVPDAEA